MVNTDIKIYKLEKFLRIIELSDSTKSKESVNKDNFGELEKKQLAETQRLILEDFDVEPNVKSEKTIEYIKRQQKIIRQLKNHFNYKCQICGDSFPMDNGSYYCEAHHLVPLSLNGGQESENVIILCATHHRMFHYASNYIKWGNVSESERIIKIDEKEYRVKYVKTKDLKM